MQDAETANSSKTDLSLLEKAAREAGAIALSYFQNDPEVWMKSGNSPVTEADLAVDKFLAEMLQSARPDYGWLSEESEDDAARLMADRLFVVDPIDGTRGFMAGSNDWTISLAVVERKIHPDQQDVWRPVSAALFNPSRKEMYLAEEGQGAFKNGEPMKVASPTDVSETQIYVSKPMYGSMKLERLGAVRTSHIASLAYRLALVATGEISAAIAKPNSHDWDLAAADLLVQEAGGILLGAHGDHVSYNAALPKHGVLVAAEKKMARTLLDLTSWIEPL
ncbi:MAG: 3'(2'),5'-bisphosphate nucleotidase CysQ [Hyphomicrobiales bacterium]